eukprot:1121707-Pyramimonas_sp.AAC.1
MLALVVGLPAQPLPPLRLASLLGGLGLPAKVVRHVLPQLGGDEDSHPARGPARVVVGGAVVSSPSSSTAGVSTQDELGPPRHEFP